MQDVPQHGFEGAKTGDQATDLSPEQIEAELDAIEALMEQAQKRFKVVAPQIEAAAWGGNEKFSVHERKGMFAKRIDSLRNLRGVNARAMTGEVNHWLGEARGQLQTLIVQFPGYLPKQNSKSE